MDSATLLNIKPDPVKKTQSLTANKSEGANDIDKSQKGFKSAYKDQFKAEPDDKKSGEGKLPHNGNELPDQETSELKDNQTEGKGPVQEQTQGQTEQTVSKQPVNEDQHIKTEIQKLIAEENTRLEIEAETQEIPLENVSMALPLTEEQIKNSVLSGYSEQKASMLKDRTESLSSKVSGSVFEPVKGYQSEIAISVKADTQDGGKSKKESALGLSVIDFQQYMENSRNKAVGAQAVSSIKNFENTLKTEQLSSQMLQTDKSALLNQTQTLLSAQHINNPTSLTSITSTQSLSPSVPGFDIKPAVGKPGWSQAFNNQIMIMAGNGIQQAKLKLNPVHLGPVEVNIKLTKETAIINLSSVQVSTRDAIDGAIPRLKEMLNENGFSQVDVNVSHQDKQAQQEAANFNRSSSQERSNNEHGNSTMPGDEQLSEPGDELGNGSNLSNLAQSLNIVDYYA